MLFLLLYMRGNYLLNCQTAKENLEINKPVLTFKQLLCFKFQCICGL